MPEPCRVDELMCAVMARAIDDGDVLLEGIGTFLPSAAYELALRRHAPNATVFTPSGTVFRNAPLTCSLDGYQAAAVEVGLRQVTYGEMALQLLPAYLRRTRPAWKEFARPAQVDRWGNTNNVMIGDPAAPSVRFPGAVGIPDGTSLLRAVNLYVPRHTPRVLVERCDFVSGLGWKREGAHPEALTGRPHLLVTDLCVLVFDPERGATVRTVHPDVTLEQVRAATGFDLAAEGPAVTEPPDAEELRLIREEIDPLGLRRLEFVGARDRQRLLRQAVAGVPLPPVARVVS